MHKKVSVAISGTPKAIMTGLVKQIIIIAYAVFNLQGGVGPLAPFWIKWPLVKARVGQLNHYAGPLADSHEIKGFF